MTGTHVEISPERYAIVYSMLDGVLSALEAQGFTMPEAQVGIVGFLANWCVYQENPKASAIDTIKLFGEIFDQMENARARATAERGI